MTLSLNTPVVLTLLLLAAGVITLAIFWLPRVRERRRRLQPLAVLLRATDSKARIEALERSNALSHRDRALLAGILRKDLMAARAGSQTSPARVLTIWFIRQILGLLSDSRIQVRMDAARVLRNIIGNEDIKLAGEKEDAAQLSPAVKAAVELAGGKVLSGIRESKQQTRVLAYAELMESGILPLEALGEEGAEPLGSALRDRSPTVRRSLCEVLAAMGGDRAIELLTPLLQDPSPDLRARAAQALGSLKASATSSQIIELLKDPIPEVRAAAASALAEMGLVGACRLLVEAIIEECRREAPSEMARNALMEAAAKLSDGGRPQLAQAFNELGRALAFRLASALERNGIIERWLRESERGGSEDELLESLLSNAAKSGVSRPFLEALDASESRVRVRATVALGHSRNPNALAAVTTLLSDPEARVRLKAVGSTARLGGPLALAPLARSASDPDPTVAFRAITGLKQVLTQRASWLANAIPADFDLGSALAEAQHALLAAARDIKSELRIEAASGLGLLDSAEAVEILVALALEDDAAVREAADTALAKCQFPQVRRLLVAALEDENEDRRARAIMIVGTIGGSEAGRHLVEALRDPAPQVRYAALSALLRLDTSDLTDKLTPELRNPDPEIRAGIAAQLAKSPTPKSVEALVQALSDPEEEVRVKALGALSALGRPVRRYMSTVTARLHDPCKRVREAAAVALGALRGAWADSPGANELILQGPLSMSGAAAVVELVEEGENAPLLAALDNPQSVQSLAAFLVGPGRGKLADPVLSSLRQLDEPTQIRAITTLSRALRQTGAADIFLADLEALDSGARLMAIEVAHLLSTPEAISALEKVLESDPLPEVRSRAASVLSEMPGESVQAALLRAQAHDPDQSVRQAAARAVGLMSVGSETSEQQTPQTTN